MDVKSVYTDASDWAAGVFAGVKADQHEDATPCAGWNVRELMNHMVSENLLFAGLATDAEMPAGDGPPPDFIGGDAIGAWRNSSVSLVETMDIPGVMEKSMDLGVVELHGAAMYQLATSEALVHAWDLAQATGQDTSFDSDLARAVYDFTVPGVEFGRSLGAYGPPVEVADDDPIQHKLVALLGRTP